MRLVTLLLTIGLVTACQGGWLGGGAPIHTYAVGRGNPKALESVVNADASLGTVPAIVMLHGCDGVHTNATDWKARFEKAGWHVMILDSHGPRGVRDTCDADFQGRGSTPLIRVGDAFGALDHLAAQPHINNSKIFVMGWSEGGTVAGLAQTDRMLSYYQRANQPVNFAGAISVYPACILWSYNERPIGKSTLVVIGDSDEWTTAAACTAFSNNYGGDLDIHVIRGATHSFDILRSRSGRLLGPFTFKGYRMVPSHSHTEAAARIVGNYVGADLN